MRLSKVHYLEEVPLMQDSVEGSSKPTRPSEVGHRAARRGRDVQRYTVDLSKEQRVSLAMYAALWGVDKSRIVRTLLFLLDGDSSLRERVQQELFKDDEGTGDTATPAKG